MDIDTMLAKCVEMAKSAMIDCRAIHKLLCRVIDGDQRGNPEAACLGYFACASSKMRAAEALYALVDNNSTNGDMTSTKVFDYYRLFESEFLNAYADGASFQHVLIYYNNLFRILPDSLFDIGE